MEYVFRLVTFCLLLAMVDPAKRGGIRLKGARGEQNVNNVIMKILSGNMKSIAISIIRGQLGPGEVYLKNLQVKSLTKPSISLRTQRNDFHLTIKNFGVEVAVALAFKSNSMPKPPISVDVDVEDVDLDLALRIDNLPNGGIFPRLTKCHANIGNLDMDINGPRDWIDQNKIQSLLTSKSQICNVVRNLLNTLGSGAFSKLQGKIKRIKG